MKIKILVFLFVVFFVGNELLPQSKNGIEYKISVIKNDNYSIPGYPVTIVMDDGIVFFKLKNGTFERSGKYKKKINNRGECWIYFNVYSDVFECYLTPFGNLWGYVFLKFKYYSDTNKFIGTRQFMEDLK